MAVIKHGRFLNCSRWAMHCWATFFWQYSWAGSNGAMGYINLPLCHLLNSFSRFSVKKFHKWRHQHLLVKCNYLCDFLLRKILLRNLTCGLASRTIILVCSPLLLNWVPTTPHLYVKAWTIRPCKSNLISEKVGRLIVTKIVRITLQMISLIISLKCYD